MDCPDFDDDTYENILEWAKADVQYADTFVDGRGNVKKNEKLAHWALHWDHGFIGFDSIQKREDKDIARMAAAMFVYLWTKGVSADLADCMCQLYANWRRKR
jgi:hypothetical protein